MTHIIACAEQLRLPQTIEPFPCSDGHNRWNIGLIWLYFNLSI
jgi:hypothetical protein